MNQIYLKKDIVRYLAKDSGYSQRVCGEVLESLHNLLDEAISNGDRIQDYGIIDIQPVFVPAHIYGNPQDNSIKVPVEAKYKIKIKTGDRLKRSAAKLYKNTKNTKTND